MYIIYTYFIYKYYIYNIYTIYIICIIYLYSFLFKSILKLYFFRWPWKMSFLLLDCIPVSGQQKITVRNLIVNKTESAYFLLILFINSISVCMDWETENW